MDPRLFWALDKQISNWGGDAAPVVAPRKKQWSWETEAVWNAFITTQQEKGFDDALAASLHELANILEGDRGAQDRIRMIAEELRFHG